MADAFVVKEEVNYSGPNEFREVLVGDGLQRLALVERSRTVVPLPVEVGPAVQPPAPASAHVEDEVPF